MLFGCYMAGGMLFRVEGCFGSDFTADTFSSASSQWFCYRNSENDVQDSFGILVERQAANGSFLLKHLTGKQIAAKAVASPSYR